LVKYDFSDSDNVTFSNVALMGFGKITVNVWREQIGIGLIYNTV